MTGVGGGGPPAMSVTVNDVISNNQPYATGIVDPVGGILKSPSGGPTAGGGLVGMGVGGVGVFDGFNHLWPFDPAVVAAASAVSNQSELNLMSPQVVATVVAAGGANPIVGPGGQSPLSSVVVNQQAAPIINNLSPYLPSQQLQQSPIIGIYY